MTSLAAVLAVGAAIAMMLVSRRWAPVPLIIGASYVPLEQELLIGPFHFTVIRLLVAVGVVRALLRRERVADGTNALDWLVIAWAIWACASSAMHEDPTAALIFRLGLVYNSAGIYFLIRVFCRSADDIATLMWVLAWVLLPISAEMLSEHVTSFNVFTLLGGDNPAIREGHLRAAGPFGHPILAGTVGAVSIPLMCTLWRRHRVSATVGVIACAGIIISSASSGPIMTAAAGVAALSLWPYRHHTRVFRWVGLATYIGLDLVMKAPAYYIMARIDIVGGSTGWHRARLMQSAFEHLNEWWLAGTDYTRHWMGSGVDWSDKHTDITNYYLHMGVLGGVLLMLLFIGVIVKAFAYVGDTLRRDTTLKPSEQFLMWALGSVLFAHVVTSFSVSYFDQSSVFFYLIPGAIGSLHSAEAKTSAGVASALQVPLGKSLWRPLGATDSVRVGLRVRNAPKAPVHRP